MAQTFEERLCAILVAKKKITQEAAESLQHDFKDRSKEAFDNFLLSENLVSKKDLLEALSECYEVPGCDVVGKFFKHELLMEFPQDVLVRYGLIPLERDGDILIIVASEPDNEELLPELAEYVSDEIQFQVGIRSDIVDAVMEFYQTSPFSVDQNSIDPDQDDEQYEDEKELDDAFDQDDLEEEQED
jgi:type IV pilus assembly protein PilB